MLSESDYDAAVADLYAAGTGELTWVSALERLAGRFRTKASVIRVMDANLQSIAVASYGYSQEFAFAYYDSDLHTKDPRAAIMSRVKPGEIYFDHALYDVDAMWRDPNVRAACDAIDLRYSLGAVAALPNGAVAFTALLSSDRQGHASEHAVRVFRRIAPHIAQSCALGAMLENESASRAAMMTVLSGKADGMILLDPRGAASFINDAARLMLAAGDGLAWRGNAFVTRRQPETRRIAQLIHRVLQATEGALAAGGRALISRPSGRPPYAMTVMAPPPTERFLSGRSIGCVIHIQDLAVVGLPSHEALRSVFGLTDREADFAIELVRCGGLERAAARAGMAANTARNHLQSISRKTGASGQTAVAQLLGRLA